MRFGCPRSSACFFWWGSFVGLGLATWTLQQQQQGAKNVDDDADNFYNASLYRILSCLAATCYLLDVALDNSDERRSNLVAICFAIGAALELLSTIIDSDWIMWVAVHSYLASAGLILSQPPHGPIEGVGDVLFGLGCGFDVLLSYFYWNEKFELVLVWGDVVSATLWFLNASLVLLVPSCAQNTSLDESIVSDVDEHQEELLKK